MVLPPQILLPPSRDVARAGGTAPAHVPPGTIVIGRVLHTPGAALDHTPDGQPAIRVQFPQGIVLVPTGDPIEAASQLFAQVREQEGRTLLALLTGVDRGTVFRAPAQAAAPAQGETTILIQGEPSPVETAEPVRAGQGIIAQVQPRGTRAVLQQVPTVAAEPGGATGVVVSAEGPLPTVAVEGTEILVRVASRVAPGDAVTVRVIATARGSAVVAAPAASAPPQGIQPPTSPGAQVSPPAVPAPSAGPSTAAPSAPPAAPATPPITQGTPPAPTSPVVPAPVSLPLSGAGPQAPPPAETPPPPAAIPLSGAPPTSPPGVSVEPGVGSAAPSASAPAATAPQSAPIPPDTANAAPGAAAPPTPLSRTTPPAVPPASVGDAPGAPAAPVAVLQALELPDTPAYRAAVVALQQLGTVRITADAVLAATTLQSADLPVTGAAVVAANALLDAGVAVTPQALQVAQTFVQEGAPVTAPAIAAAVALSEIAVIPSAQPVHALETVLFTPSALGADLAAVRDAVVAVAERVPPQSQALLLDISRSLTSLLVDLGGERSLSAQVETAARFGGLHTERFLGELVHAATPGAHDTSDAPARVPVPQAAATAARDVRVLLGRLQIALRELGPDATVPPEARAAIEEGATRIVDRMQGLQLQNLRAPVVEHLTLELPLTADGEFQSVQLRVFYRPDEGGKRRVIDERNTTVALLLDTTRLGKVNTTLTIADGRINTDFRVDTEAVADHMLEGANELRAALQELGYDIGRIGATARRPTPGAEPPPEREDHIGPEGIDVRV